MRLLSLSALVLVLAALTAIVPFVGAQQSAATKFDSYGRLIDDDEAARLDLFSEHLRNHPNLRGYLVGYHQETIPPGVLLRRLYGDQRYLTEARGVDRNRVVIVEGGYREAFTVELWLVPDDAPPPTPRPMSPLTTALSKRFLFDEECLGCEAAVNLDLHSFSDGLRFFAEMLQRNPDAGGLLVVRPGLHFESRLALIEAGKAKRILIGTHHIDGRRITIRLLRRRKDNLSMAEMWIEPHHVT